MALKIFLTILLIFLIPGSSDAEIYKWKDDAGKTHYTDSADKIPLKYRARGKFEKRGGGATNKKRKAEPVNKKQASEPEPDIAKEKTKFTITSWKGKKVKIKNFKVGYWKKGEPQKIKKGVAIPFQPGYQFGAVFTIVELEGDDSLTVTLRIKAPMANADGEKREIGSSFTITGNYRDETKSVSIDFDEDFLEYFEIPSHWYVRFTGSKNKVFKALTVHVAMPKAKAKPAK